LGSKPLMLCPTHGDRKCDAPDERYAADDPYESREIACGRRMVARRLNARACRRTFREHLTEGNVEHRRNGEAQE
jgi:hypothetical protein